MNDPKAKGSLSAARVVAAYPGGSPDIAASRDRVEGFTQQLQSMGVEIVTAIDQLNERCDAFLLESVDGRVHLEQFRAIAKGKPVFIDKPAAASLADVVEIFRLADRTATPCFSSSALRYCQQVQTLKGDDSLGAVTGATTTCPQKTEPHHPELFWYGIHGVESLYALLGPGCQRVICVASDKQCVAMGTWRDGRMGVFHGLKTGPDGPSPYSFSLYGEHGIRQAAGFSGYAPLVVQICDFFVNRQPPVSQEETLELFAFMEAAEQSMQNGGESVDVQSLLERAQARARFSHRSHPRQA